MRHLFLAILGWACVGLVAAGPGTHNYAQKHSNYGNEKTKDHIQEHMRAMTPEDGQETKIDDKDMVYYLFVLHDANGDGHLDGHELRAAFTDFDEGESDPTQFVSLQEVTDMVDHVLEEDDLNGDGLISWEEYIQSQMYHDQS